MKLLAIDPGDKYNGFAIYRSEDERRWEREKIGVRTSKVEIFELLRTVSPDRIVCEDFRLRPFARRPQGFSRLDTSRMVGSLEYYCDENSIPFILQTTDNRDIGYMWGSITKLPHSDSRCHAHDAQAHAVFWIIKNGGQIV